MIRTYLSTHIAELKYSKMAEATGMKTRGRGRLEARQQGMDEVQNDVIEVAQNEQIDGSPLPNDDQSDVMLAAAANSQNTQTPENLNLGEHGDAYGGARPKSPLARRGVRSRSPPDLRIDQDRYQPNDNVAQNVQMMMGGMMQEMAGMMRGMANDITAGVRAAVSQAPILQSISQYENVHPGPSGNDEHMRAIHSQSMRVHQDSGPERDQFQYPRESRYRSRSETNQDRRRGLMPRRLMSEETTGDESEDNADQISLNGSVRNAARHNRQNPGPKLPVFTGKERWEVWFNRFQDVANRQQWDNERRLDEMLPRLQGQAGEFVFGQLSDRVRGSFRELVGELRNRFRRVETSKSFSAKFSHREQRQSESVENYAADLKHLYDKAYPQRDDATRREDLLRRFLDGLIDEKARLHVELVKEPHDVDEAVFEVVNFLETTRKSRNSGQEYRRKPTRMVRPVSDESNDDDNDDDDDDYSDDEPGRIARAPGKQNRSQSKHGSSSMNKDNRSTDLKNKTSVGEECLNEIKKMREEMSISVKSLEERVGKLENRPGRSRYSPRTNQGQGDRSGYPTKSSGANQSRVCYRCGQEGHFARGCTTNVRSTIANNDVDERGSTPGTAKQLDQDTNVQEN